MQDTQTDTVQGFRLSPQQQHAWTAGRGLTSQCAVEVTGELDRARLRRALGQAVERHEILRTSFQLLPGMTFPVQVVAERGGFDLAHESCEAEAWGALGEEERYRAVEALLAASRSRPFDLAAGPLLRASTVEVETGSYLLLLTLPALAADRASARLLASRGGSRLRWRQPGGRRGPPVCRRGRDPP